MNILQGFGPPPVAKNQQLGRKWVENPQNKEVVMFTLFLVCRVLTIEVVEYSLSCRVLTLAYSTGCSGCKVPKIRLIIDKEILWAEKKEWHEGVMQY